MDVVLLMDDLALEAAVVSLRPVLDTGLVGVAGYDDHGGAYGLVPVYGMLGDVECAIFRAVDESISARFT